MALEILCEVEETDGCLEWDFIDSTGAYNATTNPTGYGAPNMASTAVTSATITITPHGYTTGYVFAFTIAAGTITACTVTAPDGTVTNIFADLEHTAFPFTEDEPFTIFNEWLGGEEDSEFTSNHYNFEYSVTNGTETYDTDLAQLIVCAACCCVHNMQVNLDPTECECQDEAIEKATRAQIYLDAAIFAMEENDVDKSYDLLQAAMALCENECTNC